MSTHLHTAGQKYLKSLETRGLSIQHIRTVKYRLNKIIKAFPSRPMDSIKLEELEKFVDNYEGSARTKHHLIAVLKSLFHWAQDHDLLSPDRITAAHRLKSPKDVPAEPGIFTPEEMRRMLRCAVNMEPHLLWVLHVLVLGGFCGIRTAEIHRLNWSDILLDHSCVRLSQRITKTGSRRIAKIPENGVEWLRLTLRSGKVIPENVYPQNIQRYMLQASTAAMVEWKHNGLRHSYVSYAMAQARNAWEVAEQVGNSPKILQAHYKGLVLPAEAEEWFSLSPETTL